MEYTILDDRITRLQYRSKSSYKSNNLPTIDIYGKAKENNRKIHIDTHQNKGVK